ncbi:hypothetical protein [Rickettsiella endosymbiont of Rhagonycha lignosa]|uniref:hypothetical protein n=1 Tax=Rickettsiella endosymbiont of Rhagonycha lignosa TaxID=3077937 RepID=UPI00313AA9D6
MTTFTIFRSNQIKSTQNLKNENKKINFNELLQAIKLNRKNVRLEKFKALTKQYKLNFSNLSSLMDFLSLFPEKNQFELVNIPEIWAQIKIKFAEIGKRPGVPYNHKETLLLLKKLDEVYHFQDFLRKFSVKNKNDQFNLFLQFQNSNLKLLTECLKSPQGIIELFRCISETPVSDYFNLPIIDTAINNAFFSWDHVLSMLKTFDNHNVYLFVDYLLEKNKLNKTIDIEQLKILLIGLNCDKRSNFIDYLYSKKLISPEIKPADFIRLGKICFFKNDDAFIQTNFVQEQLARISFSGEDIDALFSSLPGLEEFLVKQLNKHEDQLNNNTPKCNLFFANKGKRQLSLPTIEEECYENKKIKLG